MVPLIFGLQQTSEGLVWVGLQIGHPVLTRVATLTFLFPALCLWPFWVSFLMWFKEERPLPSRILLGIMLCSTVWFWGYFLPVALGPAESLTTRIHNHSIAYEFEDLKLLGNLPAGLGELCYLLLVTVPFLLGSGKREHVWAFVIAVSAVVSYVLCEHAFVSVWCFFAARPGPLPGRGVPRLAGTVRLERWQWGRERVAHGGSSLRPNAVGRLRHCGRTGPSGMATSHSRRGPQGQGPG